jgi:hypothetical protein
MGETLGRQAGAQAGAEEAFKHFKIAISKERVLALKRVFAEVGSSNLKKKILKKRRC